MTPELIATCTGSSIELARKHAPYIVATMDKYEISVKKTRIAMYLAQIGVESGHLVYMKEIWGPTPAQKRYERDFNAPWPSSPSEAKEPEFAVNRLAYTLGNDVKGDGSKYRGYGPIQITGKHNAIEIGKIMGLDLVAHPEQLLELDKAWESSGAFWKWKDLNTVSDTGDFLWVTKRINGGTNGLPERTRLWVAGKKVLGITV